MRSLYAESDKLTALTRLLEHWGCADHPAVRALKAARSAVDDLALQIANDNQGCGNVTG